MYRFLTRVILLGDEHVSRIWVRPRRWRANGGGTRRSEWGVRVVS
jgi:hypothetical protein